MNKKECPSCAMGIDAGAKECPICGYEYSAKAINVKIIAFVLLLIFVLFFIFSRL